VLADAKAPWGQMFEAAYFTAVADIVAKDPSAARKSAEKAEKWLQAHPAPNAEAAKGTQAAVKMLRYRIAKTEAEVATGPAAKNANEAAIVVLQELLRDRPDLEGIINQQMIARLPDQPDVTKLDVLLLRAMAARGNDEIIKLADQTPDKKILGQAVAAAQELLRREGTQGLTPADAGKYMLRLALFYGRLGMDVEAANTFLNHVDRFKGDPKLSSDVLDNATGVIARLKREKGDDPATQATYIRFLDIATQPPFNRAEFNFEYAFLLLQRNVNAMEAQPAPAARQQMLADAQKAISLFRNAPDDKKLQARFYEMMAHDQLLDLAGDSPGAAAWIARIQVLADEINALVDAAVPNAKDPAALLVLRKYRVRTALLAANLAKHERGQGRAKGLERALTLLANFEQDVQGLPNANALLSEALLMRLEALMELNRPDDALKDLGKFLETRSDEQGLAVVIDMLDALGKEFDEAQQRKDEPRMAELAAHRAKVSRYLVERAAASTRPETRKLLPKYKVFEANSLQEAARLEKDDAKKKQYLADALAIYQAALRETPEDRGLRLAIAFVQFDLADYEAAQTTLAEFLSQHWLGKPMVVGQDGEMRPNHQYWKAMYQLLRGNAELCKRTAAGFGPAVLEDTKTKLMQLYITWGEPGGARWTPKFDALRQEILPGWTAPPLVALPSATQPAATQPAATQPAP
jgi:hypothetical protein